MSKLYRLDVIVRGNSTISQDDAIRWVKNWVNTRQEKNREVEYYADLYDSRTNKSWKIFSDIATINRDIQNYYICENGEKITGVIQTSPFTQEIIIDTPDGSKWIEYKNKNAKIFLQVEDSLRAIARVEGQNENGFFVVLYDGEYFDEDKVRLDCSKNPVKVNILVI